MNLFFDGVIKRLQHTHTRQHKATPQGTQIGEKNYLVLSRRLHLTYSKFPTLGYMIFDIITLMLPHNHQNMKISHWEMCQVKGQRLSWSKINQGKKGQQEMEKGHPWRSQSHGGAKGTRKGWSYGADMIGGSVRNNYTSTQKKYLMEWTGISIMTIIQQCRSHEESRKLN